MASDQSSVASERERAVARALAEYHAGREAPIVSHNIIEARRFLAMLDAVRAFDAAQKDKSE